MEAIAAFGVACNVMQAIEFSFKTISLANEILKTGSTSKDKRLSAYAKEIMQSTRQVEDWLKKLELEEPQLPSSSSPPPPYRQRLQEVAKRCEANANELAKAVAPDQNGSTKSSRLKTVFKRTTKSLFKPEYLAVLESKLKSDYDIMKTEILVNARYVSNLPFRPYVSSHWCLNSWCWHGQYCYHRITFKLEILTCAKDIRSFGPFFQ